MRLRTKLVLTNIGLIVIAFVPACLAGFGWGSSPGSEQNEIYIALLLIAFGSALCAAYVAAVWASSRVEKMARHMNDASLKRAQAPLHIRGNDELAQLSAELNRMSFELTKGEQARNALVADVAHELRTPVAILRGHLETILAGAEDMSRDNLLPLLDETKRMTRLIQDLQQLTLAEAGSLKLDWQWIRFSPMLQEVISILEPEAEDKQLELTYRGTAECEVYCDPARIKQIIINLLGNAIRYTPDSGKVLVHLIELPGEIKVDIADNGPGIPPEDVPYVFKRFYRVESSRNRKSGGMGLGLAIAKEFAEIHGGNLTVNSTLGQGTVFTLSLPKFPLK